MSHGGRNARATTDGATRLEPPPARISLMERYIRFIVRHRVVVVVAVLAVTGLLATQLVNVHLDIRRRANLPDEHPYVQIQNRISDLFGGESIVIIGVIAKRGDIFTAEMLGKIYRIT